MPLPNKIKDIPTLLELVENCYEVRFATAKYPIYERPFRAAYRKDIHVLEILDKAGFKPEHMFLTPIGDALDNDPHGWPSTKWGDDHRTPLNAYQRAYKWMLRHPVRVRAVGNLDTKLLLQGIDFSLTGDLVGRSKTWSASWVKTRGTVSENLLVQLLKAEQFDFSLDDKATAQSIGNLRQLGHNILVEYHVGDVVWCAGTEREVTETDYLAARYCPPD
jgi:hypothetical protein